MKHLILLESNPADCRQKAFSIRTLLIDPYGNFHKCWNTVGVEDEKVGKLGEPLQMDSALVRWLSWCPFEKKKCRDCKFLPLCMRGCPYFSENTKGQLQYVEVP